MWGKLRKKSLKMCKVNSKIVYLVLIYSFSRKTKNGASTTQVRLACFSFYKSLSQYFLVKSIQEGFLCRRRHQVEEAHAWVLGVLTYHSPARLEYLAAAGLSHWCPVLNSGNKKTNSGISFHFWIGGWNLSRLFEMLSRV